MPRVKVSVAMATYNGARYIQDQLLSIARQDSLPDEVIICDDCSTDDTVQIIEKLSTVFPLAITVIKNETQLGVNRNFARALSLCSGDIIFIADQDDVWFEEKISTMTKVLGENKNIQIAINDAIITNETLEKKIGSWMTNTRIMTGMDLEFIPGCCTVITREFGSLCLPFPSLEVGNKPISYDGWVHFIGDQLDAKAIVDAPLQYYRRHDANVSHSAAYGQGVSLVDRLFYYIKTFKRCAGNNSNQKDALGYRLTLLSMLLERLEAQLRSDSEMVTLQSVENVRDHKTLLEKRIAIYSMNGLRRFSGVVYLYISGGYKTFRGVKSLLVDLFA